VHEENFIQRRLAIRHFESSAESELAHGQLLREDECNRPGSRLADAAERAVGGTSKSNQADLPFAPRIGASEHRPGLQEFNSTGGQMKRESYIRLLGLAAVILLLPALAAAQTSVKCESNNGRRNYCGQYDYDQVRIDRQISGSPCVEGQTWGVDREGLWVDRGCRAYFTIGERRRDRDRDQTSLKCESNNGRRNYCGQYDRDQVRLDRQISGSPCVEGRSWGVDRQGLWVDDGCRAYFTIGRYSRRGDSDHHDDDNGWWKRDPNDTWPPRGDWHGGNWGRGGACFYKDRNFNSDYFCLRRGESRDSLGSYGDDISSIRTFGGARVTVYDDRNFSGAQQRLDGDVSDLRQLSVRQKPGHTWNNRISSVRVQ
jgi:Protein of unknown function (DUF3011)